MQIERSTPEIKAIIFDLGRVLIPFDFETGYRELSRTSGLKTEEIRQRIRETGLVERFERGLIAPEPFVEGLAAALGIEIDVAEFSRIWNSIFLKDTLIPEEMLVHLKQRYRLILLSNTNIIHFDGLEQGYPLLRHFDHHVLSFRVQMMKPDAAIYLHAVELAGCSPEECLFIDDMEENVTGAKRVGMQAVQFQSRAQLERDFSELGIEFSKRLA